MPSNEDYREWQEQHNKEQEYKRTHCLWNDYKCGKKSKINGMCKKHWKEYTEAPSSPSGIGGW